MFLMYLLFFNPVLLLFFHLLLLLDARPPLDDHAGRVQDGRLDQGLPVGGGLTQEGGVDYGRLNPGRQLQEKFKG